MSGHSKKTRVAFQTARRRAPTPTGPVAVERDRRTGRPHGDQQQLERRAKTTVVGPGPRAVQHRDRTASGRRAADRAAVNHHPHHLSDHNPPGRAVHLFVRPRRMFARQPVAQPVVFADPERGHHEQPGVHAQQRMAHRPFGRPPVFAAVRCPLAVIPPRCRRRYPVELDVASARIASTRRRVSERPCWGEGKRGEGENEYRHNRYDDGEGTEKRLFTP